MNVLLFFPLVRGCLPMFGHVRGALQIHQKNASACGIYWPCQLGEFGRPRNRKLRSKLANSTKQTSKFVGSFMFSHNCSGWNWAPAIFPNGPHLALGRLVMGAPRRWKVAGTQRVLTEPEAGIVSQTTLQETIIAMENHIFYWVIQLPMGNFY